MAAGGVPRVDVRDLTLGAELGRGGQGKVTAVAGYLIEGQWTAVLKRYSPEILAEADTSVLEELAYFPRRLSTGDGRWLLENAAWPAVLAEDDGAVCGFLMRTVPRRFYFDRQTRTLGAQQQLADVAYLLNDDTYVANVGLSVGEWHRISLLKDVAEALSRLHSLGVVFGDFSPKNVLFSVQGSPCCFLIDCDAVQLNGESVTRQIQTPDWEAPPSETHATAATDAYKFGLLAIRLFARDQSSRDIMPLRRLSPELARLAELSQEADPALRPPPAAWIAPLEGAAKSGAVQQAAAVAGQQPEVPRGRVAVPVPPVRAQTPPPVGATPPTRRNRAALAVLSAMALIAVVAVISVIASTSSGTPSQSAAPPAAVGAQDHTPGNAVTASPLPNGVGVVTIGSGIAAAPQALDVARMFNTYFTGINRHQYRRALSVFDPGGQINPASSKEVRLFARGDSTTRDSNVVLSGIRPSGGPVQSAEVTFESHQAAGMGPSDAPNETCTQWDITYKLVQSPAGAYLIRKVKTASDSAC